MSTTHSVSEHGVVRQTAEYNLPAGYLRAFIVALVVAHHAVIAYCTFAPPPPVSLLAQPRWWRAFPVVNPQRWLGFDFLVGFNDIFFMSLMFFLSGLFVWASLRRKGPGKFLRDRGLRLGVPFLLSAALVAPLAYYPAYLQSGGQGVSGFVKFWLAQGDWPAGPAWFVWVLLVLDCLTAGLFRVAPGFADRIARFASGAAQRPFSFFLRLAGASAVAFIPMLLVFGPSDWIDFGPFFLQKSRILQYPVYFLAGIAVGAFGIERGLLAQDGKLAKRWWLWAIRAGVAFLISGTVSTLALNPRNAPHIYAWGTAAGVFWVLSCAASSFAFLAILVRFAKKPVRIFDSLRDNSYGIYLIHYAFVSWVQYALLRAVLPAAMKGCVAFAGALALSWITIAALRRIRPVARVI